MENNQMYFSHDEVEQGLHLKFIEHLCNYCKDSNNHSIDLHMYTEDDAIIVEWVQISYQDDCHSKYVLLQPALGEMVMIEKSFPDRHYEMCYSEEDYQERLQEWLKENPGWERNNYGMWYNVEEQEAYRKSIEEQGEH